MPVPYLFSNVPGGTSIPLSELDSNFAYITSGNPTFANLTLTGALSVGTNTTIAGTLAVAGTSNFSGDVTTNNLAVNGTLKIGPHVVNPTGITGTGLLVFNTGPTLVAPILGTPASGDLANCTNFPVSQVSGLAANVLPFLTNPSSANLRVAVTDETGTGNLVFSNNPVLTSPTLTAPVLGTPVSGNLSACTGYPAPSLTGVTLVANGGTGMSTTGAVGDVLTVTAAGVLGYAAAPPASDVAGGAASQLLYQSAPNNTDFIPNGTAGQVLLSNGAAVPSWGQVDLVTGVTNVLPIAQGGTNSSTRQQAMDTLAGSNTLGQYLRGNGTNVVMSPILAADVPTLNQNTTGSAATFTSTTQNSQFNSIGVNVAASGVAGQINATGNIQTSTGFFSDATGTLHPLVVGTPIAASGAAVPVGGIPSWVNRVTVSFESVTSAVGSTSPQIQLGTAGGLVVAGYSSNSVYIGVGGLASSTGFNIAYGAGGTFQFLFILSRVSGNTWQAIGQGCVSGAAWMMSAGSVTLPGALSQLSAVFVGAGTYTGGTFNIMYE